MSFYIKVSVNLYIKVRANRGFLNIGEALYVGCGRKVNSRHRGLPKPWTERIQVKY